MPNCGSTYVDICRIGGRHMSTMSPYSEWEIDICRMGGRHMSTYAELGVDICRHMPNGGSTYVDIC